MTATNERSDGADERLASYGTLAPGRSNHHQLAGLRGSWRRGTVRGWLNPAGWAARVGYPGLVLDPAGPIVEVFLFESADLRAHWERLDAFEGSDYRRVVTRVFTDEGVVEANIYAVREDPDPSRRG
jgi:gamma-glutamylcyclotransferase (GGCT)/AIG2-like uncharacterized protein YtfP